MAKPYKYRELVKILREHAPRVEFWSRRGKGSERIIYHPDIEGQQFRAVFQRGHLGTIISF